MAPPATAPLVVALLAAAAAVVAVHAQTFGTESWVSAYLCGAGGDNATALLCAAVRAELGDTDAGCSVLMRSETDGRSFLLRTGQVAPKAVLLWVGRMDAGYTTVDGVLSAFYDTLHTETVNRDADRDAVRAQAVTDGLCDA